ncbi:MAG: PHP domain-containing protein [Waddliaceae bacterium]
MIHKEVPAFRADLHCHSTCSDGTLSPKEIVDLAKSLGLSGLSITDHDTICAYKSSLPYAGEIGIKMISGVEFSTEHKGVSVHILGYSFSLKNPAVHEFCLKHKERREKRCLAILELLRLHQMPILKEEIHSLQPKGNIGRPHIALAMVKKGYVQSVEKAFTRYLGDGRPCYVKGEAFSVEESIDLIHQANGIAVIAHPHLIKPPAILNDLLNMDFDGLEGYYASIGSRTHVDWIELAKKRNWIVTGGSDFHGEIKPNHALGSSWVGQEVFDRLHDHFLSA